jgi:hypothetical protein
MTLPRRTGAVEDQGVPVLVLTVAAPEPGQRIFTLRKDLTVTTHKGGSKGYPAGTIFVRYPGRKEIAGPGDIRALEDRYAAPALESARARQRSQFWYGGPMFAAQQFGQEVPSRRS